MDDQANQPKLSPEALMIAIPDHPSMTPEEYLHWEEQQESRHEYVDGAVYARNEVYGMTGDTVHNDIALNLYSALRPPLRAKGCRVNVADVKVQVAAAGPFFYPDLLVSCHLQDKAALQFVCHPCLIVEVLSPATESYGSGCQVCPLSALGGLAGVRVD
jgi:Uma2 family endonuclease